MTTTAARKPAARNSKPTGRKIGYGRVSTEQQSQEQQRAQLAAAGCDLILTEQISSGRKDRPVLAQALAELQPGDQLVICKLDRLARSLQELLTITADLDARGVELQVLDQQLDTSTPAGRLLFSMLGAVAEFERSLAIERTRASVAHRRATGGDLGGRRPSYSVEQQQLALRLRGEDVSLAQIARQLGLTKTTVHRMLRQAGQQG